MGKSNVQQTGFEFTMYYFSLIKQSRTEHDAEILKLVETLLSKFVP